MWTLAILKNSISMIYVGRIAPIITIDYTQIEGPVQKQVQEKTSFWTLITIYTPNAINPAKHAVQAGLIRTIIAIHAQKIINSLAVVKINMQ